MNEVDEIEMVGGVRRKRAGVEGRYLFSSPKSPIPRAGTPRQRLDNVRPLLFHELTVIHVAVTRRPATTIGNIPADTSSPVITLCRKALLGDK
jgi:hypothetical protein